MAVVVSGRTDFIILELVVGMKQRRAKTSMVEGAHRVLLELKLLRVDSLKHVERSSRSPVVFAHGYPDSPLMFKEYYSGKEQKNDWLRGRSIYTIAFPNRRTNRVMPSLLELIRRKVYLEFSHALQSLMHDSPTGKLVLVAHDWGSTYCWDFIRNHTAMANGGVEAFVSLSVGSSFRYDLKEHGLKAFQWMYSGILCLAYYFPFYPVHWLLWKMLAVAAGYKAETAPNAYDAWHYWFGRLEILRAPFDIIGLTYTKEFKDYRFPLLYIRHRSADRIAVSGWFLTLCSCVPRLSCMCRPLRNLRGIWRSGIIASGCWLISKSSTSFQRIDQPRY